MLTHTKEDEGQKTLFKRSIIAWLVVRIMTNSENQYVYITGMYLLYNVYLFIFIRACQLYAMTKKSILVSSDLQRGSVERGSTSNRGNTELMSACQYFITSPGFSFSNHFLYSFFIYCALWGEKLLTKTSEQGFEAGQSS